MTFEELGFNGGADTRENNGIIDEVDLIFSSGVTHQDVGHVDLRWNTNSSYPSSYSLYDNPYLVGAPAEFDEIGPVDLEDIAAHELGHGVGLDHIADGDYTLHPTDYEIDEWWEKTFRRSLEDGDKAGKVYQAPSITSTSQQIPHLLLGAPSTIDVTGSFTVPSGKTFEVESGKTLQFNTSTGIFSRGEMILDDVTLEKDPSGGSFNYLYLYGSGADGSTIIDVEISGSTYGIHTNNLSDTEMDGVSASDNNYQGLKIYNSSNIDVIGSTFEDATYYGVYVDDSYNIYFKSGTRFEDNGYDGIAVRGYSSAFFGDGNEEADAVVKNNDRYGLNIYSNSLLTIGYTAGNFGGNNSVVSNSTYNARVTGTSGLVAEDTWWGSAIESTILSTLYWDGSSTIDYTPWLTSPGPSKNATSPVLVVGPEDADGLSNDELTPALLVKRYGELVARDRKQALAMLRALQNHANPEVGRAVRILLMRALLHDGKVAEGIAYGTDLLTDEALAVAGRAVVAKRLFYVYLLDLGDTRRALEMLALLAPLDEEDVENGLLATLYEHVTGAAPIIPEPSSAKRASEAVPRLTVYPNPFNPMATLRYTLVQQGPVRLTVLDLLGRDVAVLVDDVQQAGTHAVRFNGAGLASGVYFYRLDAGAEVLTGKMLLMK